MKKYTKDEILKAAEIGEVSIHDAKHIVSLLDEARHVLKVGFDCHKCANAFSNPFDQFYCTIENETGENYDIENDEDCNGKFYKKSK
jgi:hypothetical protein